MRRFAPGWAWLIGIAGPLFETEGGGAGGDGGAGGAGGGGGKDAEFYKSEAQKAFQARDEVKKRLRELEEGGLVITADQKQRLADLEKAAADAEEARRKKEGEFEAWRKDVTTKHQTELQKASERTTALEREIAGDKISAAFGAATDFFGGGEKSKTILTPTLAHRALGEYVSYEEYDFGEDDGGKRKTIVVRDAKGKIIRGDNGHPAGFADAIGRLIESHPDKDHILRGSGRAGSGARGGADGRRGGQIDWNNLTPEQMRDPDVIEQAKRRTASAGGIVMGEAFERRAAAKR
jgi:hypothetical protein